MLKELFLPSEEKCLILLRGLRWPGGVVCPICGSRHVKKNGHQNGKQTYWCHKGKHAFRDTTKTLFCYSKLPLEVWFYLMLCMEHPVSTKRLGEELDRNYGPLLNARRKLQRVCQRLPQAEAQWDHRNRRDVHLCWTEGHEVYTSATKKSQFEVQGARDML